VRLRARWNFNRILAIPDILVLCWFIKLKDPSLVGLIVVILQLNEYIFNSIFDTHPRHTWHGI